MAVAVVVAAAPHLQCQLVLMQSSSHMVALVMSAWIIWATRALVKDFLGGAGMFVPVSMANMMSYIASTARSSRYVRSFASHACSV